MYTYNVSERHISLKRFSFIAIFRYLVKVMWVITSKMFKIKLLFSHSDVSNSESGITIVTSPSVSIKTISKPKVQVKKQTF